ncbi:hypothetical protein A9Q96_02160 [Rhodobacterales bacterium 52_120_T64]|nr:hypothetical protein A9Q96_02160 [Rhodobacterales bacterium 52_120_T64]
MVSINVTDIRNEAQNLRPSVTVRLARSFFDMRATTEELLSERPSEARLLLLVLLSDMIFTLSWALKTLIAPTAAATSSMGSDVVLWLMVALMLRTTAIYALALVVGVVVKLFGGKATLFETRVGVIWGVFVAAPIGLIIAEFAVVINQFDGSLALLQSQGIQMTPYWLGMVPFVWFVSKGAAAANRIDNVVPIFGTIAALAVVLVGGVRYMAM